VRQPQVLLRLIYSEEEPGQALAAAVELAQQFKLTTVTELVNTLYPEGNVPPRVFDICSDAIDILKTNELSKQRKGRRTRGHKDSL
jgi:hypothetical protein